jgi:hypothetical protein
VRVRLEELSKGTPRVIASIRSYLLVDSASRLSYESRRSDRLFFRVVSRFSWLFFHIKTITIEIPNDLATRLAHLTRMSRATIGWLLPSSGMTGA